MDIHQLETFLAVVEQGSFSGAAKALGRTQPAVSQVIGRLEDELGQRLFERPARRGGMTDAGKALVGLLLLAGWILCVRATWVSLGALGVVIAGALIAAFVWWLVSVGIVATDHRTFTWIALVAVGVVLGIGMGWSIVRGKATGQVETD